MEQEIKLNIENKNTLKFLSLRIKLPLIVAVDGGDQGPHAGDWD